MVKIHWSSLSTSLRVFFALRENYRGARNFGERYANLSQSAVTRKIVRKREREREREREIMNGVGGSCNEEFLSPLCTRDDNVDAQSPRLFELRLI